MLSKKLLRAIVLCLAVGMFLGVSSSTYAQEEPPVEEAEAVVDDEHATPLPRGDERPLPESVVSPADPSADVVIAPAPGEVVEPGPAPTGEDVVISPSGGETIGIEDESGFEWGVAAALAAAVLAVALIAGGIVRSQRTHRQPITH